MKDYFFKPPINKLGLNFLESSLESAYRKSYQEEVRLFPRLRLPVSPCLPPPRVALSVLPRVILTVLPCVL